MEAIITFKEKTNNSIIEINGQEKYISIGNNGLFIQKIALQRSSDSKMILEAYFRILPPKFKVIMADGNEFHFKMENMQALKYLCEKNGTLYEIYQHKDRKHSIFRNDTQVAYFDKAEFAKFGADKYTLIADEHSDIELFLGFIMILHIIHGSNKQSVYSKDKGNVWEKRAFDISWNPK
jgi:hypothetical protein